MAFPDFSDVEAGTPFTWEASGGTHALTLTSLGSDAGRQGVKSASLIHATKGRPEFLDVLIESAVAAAATNGKEIELYFSESVSATAGTGNPGGLSGTDVSLSSPDEIKAQLNFVGALTLANSLGTGVQRQRHCYQPACEFISPAVVNKSGQALTSTAANHKITVTPYYRRILEGPT